MKPADVQLIEQILQTTKGGSRLLCTLARRGKALERDEPRRAALLLDAVRFHPLYKGGRLTFDMLEIEDLMLDGSPAESMTTSELSQVLSAGARNLVDALRRMGSGPQAVAKPGETIGGEPDPLTRRVGAPLKGTDVPGATTPLPRVSFGPAHGAVAAQTFPASEVGAEAIRSEPELQSSDYLYDCVVLGFLDLLGGHRISQS
jgi:hypothetical protein